jgi:hypothetical protein
MRTVRAALVLLVVFGVAVARAAEDPQARQQRKIKETSAWLTNAFTPWLTNTFPEILNKKPWPEWLIDPPSRTRLPTWLTNTFPHIDSEEFPDWLNDPVPEMLARGIPDWWGDALKKIPVVPGIKTLPAIVRGPYLQLATTNSIVVRWRTDVPSPSVLSYGSTPGKLNKHAKVSGTLKEHIVIVTNLRPDKKYFYSIGVPDTPILFLLTNRIVFASATNSVLFIGPRSTNLLLASVTNGTLVLSAENNRLSVSTRDRRFVRHTIHRELRVSTSNSVAYVTATNGTLLVSTPDRIKPLDGGEVAPKKGKKTTRHFAVGSTNTTFTGADTNTFFVTQPPIGQARPTRVWVLGDPGTRKREQRHVRDAYYKWAGGRRTDVWLTLGDNAYTSGKDEEYQGSIFAIYDRMLRQSALWPSLGNHDAGSASSPTQSGVYYDIFTLPTQGQSGGVMSGTEAYYSFDYANIHFIALDSSDSDWSEDGLMVRWLKIDLALNQQDWLIVFCHHPPYTKGNHDSDKDKDSQARMRKMREVVLPLLEAHGLDLMLAGHSHAYERSFLLDGMYLPSARADALRDFKSTKDGRADGTGIYTKPSLGPAPHEGAIYVVAGSSGQTSGGGLQHPLMALSLNVLGSLVLDIDGRRLDATFIDDKGHVRDYFTIVKGTGVK